MAKDITFLFVGAAHIDRLGKCFDVPQPGRSNPGRFIEHPGGAALNVASLVQELGAPCSLVSQIGADSSGHLVEQCLDQRRIRSLLLRMPEHSTATYTAIIGSDGHLAIALADMAICDTVNADALLGLSRGCASDWLCIDTNYDTPILSRLLDGSGGRKIVGLTVSQAKAPRLRHVLQRLDLLLTNRAEASALTGLALDAAAEDYHNRLRERGCRSAVISDGAHPVSWFLGDDSGNVSIEPLDDIVDVIGAGDALAAGILYALSREMDLPSAVQFGSRVAKIILGVEGPYLTSQHLPKLQDIVS